MDYLALFMTENKNGPLVSVITPCYNGEQHGMLPEYFRGLLSQTYDNFELIFINDGSTDGTERIFRDYEKKLKKKISACKYIRFEDNYGYIRGINKGLERVEGKYIVHLDSDDIMLSHNIESHVDFLEKNKGYGMVYSDGYVVEKGKLDKPIKRALDELKKLSGYIYEDILLQRCFMVPGMYCYRSECLKHIGKLEGKFAGRGNNLQLLTSIAYHHKIGYNEVEPVIKYVVRPKSLSHTVDLKNLYFKAYVREELDRYIVSKYGASDEAIEEIDGKYKKRQVLYQFMAGNKERLRSEYKELRSMYLSGNTVKIPLWVMIVSTLMFMFSYVPVLRKVVPKALMKTELINWLF